MDKPVYLSTQMVDAQDRTAFWRKLSETIYDDIVPLEKDGGLEGSIKAQSAGEMLITRTSFNAQHCIRSARSVANGADFCVLQAILSGESHGNYNGVEAHIQRGDVFLLDLTQAMESFKKAGSRISAVVPRSAMKHVLNRFNIHGMVLRREVPSTKLLFNYILGLERVLSGLKGSEIPAAQEALLTLLNAAVENSDTKVAFTRQIDTPMRQRIVDYISANLADPSLDVGSIMRFFRVSRTHLYRAFELEGGVAKAIRDRRLDMAYRFLINRKKNGLSVDEVKRLCGFSERAQFSKAFQERFGILPRDLNSDVMDLTTWTDEPVLFQRHLVARSGK